MAEGRRGCRRSPWRRGQDAGISGSPGLGSGPAGQDGEGRCGVGLGVDRVLGSPIPPTSARPLVSSGTQQCGNHGDNRGQKGRRAPASLLRPRPRSANPLFRGRAGAWLQREHRPPWLRPPCSAWLVGRRCARPSSLAHCGARRCHRATSERFPPLRRRPPGTPGSRSAPSGSLCRLRARSLRSQPLSVRRPQRERGGTGRDEPSAIAAPASPSGAEPTPGAGSGGARRPQHGAPPGVGAAVGRQAGEGDTLTALRGSWRPN